MFLSIYSFKHQSDLSEGTSTIDASKLYPKDYQSVFTHIDRERAPSPLYPSARNLDTKVKPPRISLARTRGPTHPPTEKRPRINPRS
jgi:hypothetical protein